MKVSAPFFRGTQECTFVDIMIGGFKNDIANDILR
jgi:hypothetical protein